MLFMYIFKEIRYKEPKKLSKISVRKILYVVIAFVDF